MQLCVHWANSPISECVFNALYVCNLGIYHIVSFGWNNTVYLISSPLFIFISLSCSSCELYYMYKSQIIKNKILIHCILLCDSSLTVLSSSAKIGGIGDDMIGWLIDSVKRRVVVIVSRLKNVFWSLNHFTSFTVVYWVETQQISCMQL